MGNEVYANGREIACKAANGKTVAAFPDVCLSPPSPPAGPVPIPYPNTAMASDTTKGSKTVQISGQEVMLKDQSTFKKSTGDEAATKSLGMGVVTHQITGEVSFAAWSMDVKFEGANVDRHLDMTVHNEQCFPANTPTWPYLDNAATSTSQGCERERQQVSDNCSGDQEKDCENPDCQKAKKCMLVPHTPLASQNQTGCCPGDTPHHMIEVHGFSPPGGRKEGLVLTQFGNYNPYRAPCVCVSGTRYQKEHGKMHAVQGAEEIACMSPDGPRSQMGGAGGNSWTYARAREATIKAHHATFKDAGPDGKPCSPGCLAKQLDNYHKQVGVNTEPGDTPLRADRAPLQDWQKEWGQEMAQSISLPPSGSWQ